MSTVEEIERAIEELPQGEIKKLTDRLIARREAAWDQQIESDAASGKLDALWAEAEKEIDAGETMTLDEFLDHKELQG